MLVDFNKEEADYVRHIVGEIKGDSGNYDGAARQMAHDLYMRFDLVLTAMGYEDQLEKMRNRLIRVED